MNDKKDMPLERTVIGVHLAEENIKLQEENRILREAIHPHPSTKGTAPLILYFDNAQQRKEFIAAYREVHPDAKAYDV